MNFRVTLAVLLSALLAAGDVRAVPPTTAPVAPVDPAADRLTFLTLQLSSVEESIKAVTAGMKAAGYKANVAADKVEGYEKGNELMDRKGGGPVPWDQFYGKTSKSFYVPTSVETTHAQGNGIKVDSQTVVGLHPVARPRQFDYLYMANLEQAAKAKAEVARMGQKADALLARRRQLEDEQSALWATISLESIANQEIAFRPLYRLQLKAGDSTATTKPANAAQLDSLRALVRFLRAADHAGAQCGDRVSTDQAKAIQDLKTSVEAGYTTLQESLFLANQASDLNADDARQVKSLAAIAKRSALACKNIVEARKLASEGDAAQDEPRKLTFRGQMQESLLGFSQATRDLDEAITQLAEKWNVRGTPGVPSVDPTVETTKPVAPAMATTAPASPATAPAVAMGPTVPPAIAVPAADGAAKPVVPTTPGAAAGGTPRSIFETPASGAGGSASSAFVVVIPTGSGQTAKKVFAADEKLTSTITFTAAEGPYELKDKVNMSAAKGAKAVGVHSEPGAEVQGGTITIGGDLHVHLKGDAAHPTIFRNVTFNQFYGGYFTAEYVVFDNCHFNKVGNWYANGGLTAKWKFEYCLLRECGFQSFSWIDHGVRFINTTFVSMKIPVMGGNTPKDKPQDNMRYLRTEWRKIDTCAFIDCSMPPSVFWCSESSNFYKCKFQTGLAFESDKSTEVRAYVTESVGDAPDKVFALHPAKRSPLNVIYAAQPYPVFSFPSAAKPK